MSKRPPLLGYNHNVRHAGRLFHVQTEDSGLSRLYVTTHLFIEGTILSTTRTQYTADEPDEVVQKKMQTQHKTMLKRLRDGDFDNLNLPDQPARSQPVKPVETSAAAPREVDSEAAQSTLRMALPDFKQDGARQTAPLPTDIEPASHAAAEGVLSAPSPSPGPSTSQPPVQPAGASPGEGPRPAAVPAGPILAPVAPPPIPPRVTPPSGSLAERLRLTPSAAVGGLLAEVPAAAPPTQADLPARLTGPQPVLEFEAELPGDEDDLEPAVTIEVVEPAPAEAEGGEPALSTQGEPAPVEAPAPISSPITAPITVPTAPVVDPTTAPVSPGTAAMPILSLRPTVPPSPSPLAPVASGSAARPFLPAGLRSKPTAEGVVLQRTLVPTPLVRPGIDSVRTTSPRARPTSPAPLAVSQPAHPMDDDRSLDPVVLAYLAREIRPRG